MKYILWEMFDFISAGFLLGLGFWISCYLVLWVTGWIEEKFRKNDFDYQAERGGLNE